MSYKPTMDLDDYEEFLKVQKENDYKYIAYIEYSDYNGSLSQQMKVCDIKDLDIETNYGVHFSKSDNDKEVYGIGNVTFLKFNESENIYEPVKNTPGHYGFDFERNENNLCIQSDAVEFIPTLRDIKIENIDEKIMQLEKESFSL